MRTIYIGKLVQYERAPINGNMALKLILEIEVDKENFFDNIHVGEHIIITQTPHDIEVELARRVAVVRKKMVG